MTAAALVVTAMLAHAAGSEEAARVFEREAFTAIEQGRFCDAARLFYDAHRQAPAHELLFNAGLAAEKAGDVFRARSLFSAIPSSSNKAEAAERHLQALEGKDGEQSRICPWEAPEPQPVTAPLVPPAPFSDGAPIAEAPKGPSILAVTTTVTGAGLTLAGLSAWGLGVSTYLRHGDARAQLDSARDNGLDQATIDALGVEQTKAREEFESWGSATLVAGIVTAAVGIVVGVVGVVMLAGEGS